MPRKGRVGGQRAGPDESNRRPHCHICSHFHSPGGAGSGKSALMEIRLFLETPEDAEEGEQRDMRGQPGGGRQHHRLSGRRGTKVFVASPGSCPCEPWLHPICRPFPATR